MKLTREVKEEVVLKQSTETIKHPPLVTSSDIPHAVLCLSGEECGIASRYDVQRENKKPCCGMLGPAATWLLGESIQNEYKSEGGDPFS